MTEGVPDWPPPPSTATSRSPAREQATVPLSALPLEHVDISVRAKNVLTKFGVTALRDIAGLSEAQLWRTPNCGRKTVREIIALCREYGVPPPSDSATRANNPSTAVSPPAVEATTGTIVLQEVKSTGDALAILDHLEAAIDVACKDDRSATILRHRLSLGGEHETLAQLGEAFEISRERVRQLEVKSMGRLRGALKRLPFPFDVSPFRAGPLREDRGAQLGRLYKLFEAQVGPRGAASATALSLFAGTELAWFTCLHQVKRLEISLRRRQREEARALHARRRDDVRSRRWQARFTRGILIRPARRPTAPLPVVEQRVVTHRLLGSDPRIALQKAEGGSLPFESNLEHRCLAYLDAWPAVAAIVAQSIRVPYTLAGRRKLYYPDFGVTLTDGRVLVVEAKAVGEFADFRNYLKWRAAAKMCRERGYGFTVVSRSGDSLVSYARRSIDAQAEQLLCDLAATGVPVGLDVLRREGERLRLSTTTVIATCLRHDLCIMRGPWRLGPLGQARSWKDVGWHR